MFLPPYLREVTHDAGVLFVQVVAFGLVGDELVQLGDEACGVARAQPRAQVVVNAVKEAEVHLSVSGNAQAVACGAEGFFVGGDDADASGVVGVVVFARGAGKRATLALLPAIGKQPRGDVRSADVRALVERGVVAGLHEFDVAHG